MLAPLVFSRPEFADEVSQYGLGTLLYFGGTYTIGIVLGNQLETTLDRLAAYRSHLIGVALLSSAILVELQLAQVNRFGSYSMQEMFLYLQKICLAALVLLWLRALAGKQPGVLRVLAGHERAGGVVDAPAAWQEFATVDWQLAAFRQLRSVGNCWRRSSPLH